MKSTWKGKKAVARGTKRTPPPTPLTGATTPTASEKRNSRITHLYTNIASMVVHAMVSAIHLMIK
jgi:hypothetical protein